MCTWSGSTFKQAYLEVTPNEQRGITSEETCLSLHGLCSMIIIKLLNPTPGAHMKEFQKIPEGDTSLAAIPIPA